MSLETQTIPSEDRNVHHILETSQRISEKQRLPVKKAGFYGEKLQCGRFYDRLERDYVIYVHIDVNLDWKGVGLLLLDRQ